MVSFHLLRHIEHQVLFRTNENVQSEIHSESIGVTLCVLHQLVSMDEAKLSICNSSCSQTRLRPHSTLGKMCAEDIELLLEFNITLHPYSEQNQSKGMKSC